MPYLHSYIRYLVLMPPTFHITLIALRIALNFLSGSISVIHPYTQFRPTIIRCIHAAITIRIEIR